MGLSFAGAAESNRKLHTGAEITYFKEGEDYLEVPSHRSSNSV